MSLLLLFQGSSSPVTHATTGALVGPGAVVEGTARRFRAHATSGALAGQGSVVDGAATRFRAHPSSGVLAGPGSVVSGSAARVGPPVTHATTGTLTGPGVTLSGSVNRFRAHANTGALAGQGATVAGSAELTTSQVQTSGGWLSPIWGRHRTQEDIDEGRKRLGVLPPEQEAKAVEAVQEAVLASVALTQSKPETQAATDALQAQRRAEEQFIAAYMAVYPQLVEAQIHEALAMEILAREAEEEFAMVLVLFGDL